MFIALTLHILATVIWIGGMFFAHTALRPVAAMLLAPPQRLPLLLAVFRRFFAWVWGAVAALWGSGLWLIYRLGGFGAVTTAVHVMMAVALAMTLLFVFLYFGPFQAMGRALVVEDFKGAAQRLALIRSIVTTNLVLGLLNIVIATIGRYW